MKSYYRNPRTHRERAAYFGSIWNDVGIRVRIRARRGAKRLPTDYDDISKLCTRNWKAYRRRQCRRWL